MDEAAYDDEETKQSYSEAKTYLNKMKRFNSYDMATCAKESAEKVIKGQVIGNVYLLNREEKYFEYQLKVFQDRLCLYERVSND